MGDRRKDIRLDLKGETEKGEMNFIGCLRKYIDVGDHSVDSTWKQSETFESNIRSYENTVLDLVDREIPIANYTDDDVDDLIRRIEDQYGERTGRVYGKTTLDGFRRLFWYVYRAGFMHGEYEDRLLWKERGIIVEDTKSVASARKERQRRRKSFSVSEEIKLVEFFKSIGSDTSEGELYGVLCMLCLGLRNNEAAGLSFEDIKEIPGSGFYCAYIIKTTVGDTNELKVGGKTYNAARILPLFDFLVEMIHERLKTVTGCDDVEDAMKIGGKWPIACRGNKYTIRCSSNDLTAKAGEVFSNVLKDDKYREAGLVELQEKLKAAGIEEKNMTAYLMRRNTATHLYVLGLAPSQIQYYIGHEVEDPNELRNYFTNPDRLSKIYEILKRHPFNILFGKRVPKDDEVVLKHGSTTYLRIVADEPGQAISLSVEGLQNTMTVIKSDASISDGFRRCIDISRYTDSEYGRLLDKSTEEDNAEDEVDFNTDGDMSIIDSDG